jgi:hypothetical protein
MLLCLIAARADGVIFVSPTGDDSAPGTYADPKRTIKTALEQLPPGVTLILFGGVYDASNQGEENLFGLSFSHPGQSLLAYPDDVPIIDWTGTSPGAGDRFFDVTPVAGDGTIAGITFRSWSRETSFLRIEDTDGVTIRDCTFDAVAPLGTFPIIDVDDASRVTIERCSFVNRPPTSLYYAIRLGGDATDAVENYVVRDCVFNGPEALADDDGRGAGLIAIEVDDLEVSGCRGVNAGNNPSKISPRHFVELAGVRDAVISDMSFQRYLRGHDQSHPLHDADGIKIGSWAGAPSTNVRVEQCELWGAGHGVHVGNDSELVDIAYVWCDSTYDDCIFCNDGARDVTIRRVVSHYSQDNGIDIQGDGVDVAECTIVRARNAAINVRDTASGVTFRDVLVYDVRDPESWPTSLACIEATSAWSFDHDGWYDPDGGQTTFRFDGAIRTFAEWQAAGQDPNGLFGVDPLLCNPDGRAWPIFSADFAVSPDTPIATAGTSGGPIGALPADCAAVDVATGDAPVVTRPLLGARPNPATGRVQVSTPRGERIDVYDATGRRVRTLGIPAGSERIEWDGRDEAGARVASGVYFLVLDGGRAAGRLVVTR